MTTSGPPQIWSSSDFPYMCLKDERRRASGGDPNGTSGDVLVAEIIDTGLPGPVRRSPPQGAGRRR